MPLPFPCSLFISPSVFRVFRRCLSAVLGLSLLAAMPSAFAQGDGQARLAERWDEKRATQLLNRAVRLVEEKGEAAFSEFGRQGPYVDKDLYVYVLASDGRFLASGGSSAVLVGQNVMDHRDASGKTFFRDMLAIASARGEGRVEYRWQNPAANREEPKITLFRKVGDYVVAVGFYAPRATAAQARDLLKRAAEAIGRNEADALAAFQRVDGGYMQDDLYVFVVSLDDNRFRAHGVSPALVGRDGRELQDPKGKPIIADMLRIVRDKGEGELDYAWRNPVTGKVESKHTYFRAVGRNLVAVGYYNR